MVRNGPNTHPNIDTYPPIYRPGRSVIDIVCILPLVNRHRPGVDIDRDRSTQINRRIGVDIWIGVGTIFHHTWDHDFLVDVCPGPFLTTYGTIGQWSTDFFGYESTLTVDFDRIFSEIDGRCDIDYIFT